MFDADPSRVASMTHMDPHQRRRQRSRESIDVDRSRKVGFERTARKPAPMLVPDRLTVKISEAEASHLQINSLEGSLMIEWE